MQRGMADLVTGGIVGALFGELSALVKDVVKTAVLFRSHLINLESTLEYIKPIVKDIESFNKMLDRPKEEMERLRDLMKGGITLVKKSARVKANLYKRYTYSNKLADLDADILRFFQMYIIVNARDSKEILLEVKDIRLALRNLSVMTINGQSNKDISKGGSEGFQSCVVPKAPDFLVGLNESVRVLKNRLLEEGLSMIIVSAPGGCGKTTLVQALCQDTKIKGKFKDNILFVTVSQSPNFSAMVQSMIHYKGKDAPVIETEQHAIDQLHRFLEELGKDPVLLVLDDVWSESESILENFILENVPDYKILVTSRFELSQFGNIHKVNPLNDEDARKLFLHSVTPRIGGSFRSQSSMKANNGFLVPRDELIDEVVKRCKGSPLALTVVGKSLCGKHPKIWESKLREWSEGSFIDSNQAIFNCLRKSLDDLDVLPVYKGCFMDLGSFPEDHAIPATALFDMWIQLHKLDADGIHANGILHELAARNLVNLVSTKTDDSKGDGFYGDLYVRQHDLLRELAIYHNSLGNIEERKRINLDVRNNKFPDWFTYQFDKPLSACLLSISTDESFSSVWPQLEVPEMEVLVLNFRTKKYSLPMFIKNLVNLKTIIITNNGMVPAELTNFNILSSLPNLERIRLERIQIQSSDVTLDSLQKASFFTCDLSQGMPAMPNLTEIDIAFCGELETLPVSFYNMTSLRKINITSCHNLSSLSDQIGSLVNVEVLRLSSCTKLAGLPGAIGLLQNLAFLDVSDCTSLMKLPNEIGMLGRLKELHIKGCLDLSEVPRTVVNLEQLKYVICDKYNANLWIHYKRRLPKMKVEIVEDDINLEWLNM